MTSDFESTDSGEAMPSQIDCAVCPHRCHANRPEGKFGFCRSDTGFYIASICQHHGEEPAISGKHGICNLFFSHCNMQCVYCQNYQISRNNGEPGKYKRNLPEVVDQVVSILASGSNSVGFVSPSHFIPQVRSIVGALAERECRPTFIFNTNAYDRWQTIASLEGVIDVWLPDLKYMDERLGRIYSGTPNYPHAATTAIKEMFRQVGADLHLGEDGTAESGLIIRHLVLPGQVDNSKAVLRWIADELSPSVHLSLMSQYSPTPAVRDHPELGRTLRADEYAEVVEELERLGFYRGWTQELESSAEYRPDFESGKHPFEGD